MVSYIHHPTVHPSTRHSELLFRYIKMQQCDWPWICCGMFYVGSTLCLLGIISAIVSLIFQNGILILTMSKRYFKKSSFMHDNLKWHCITLSMPSQLTHHFIASPPLEGAKTLLWKSKFHVLVLNVDFQRVYVFFIQVDYPFKTYDSVYLNMSSVSYGWYSVSNVCS